MKCPVSFETIAAISIKSKAFEEASGGVSLSRRGFCRKCWLHPLINLILQTFAFDLVTIDVT